MAAGFTQKWNAAIKKYVPGVHLAVVVFIGLGCTHADAQTPNETSIHHLYGKVLEEVEQDKMKAELIRFFEDNFSELIADIENTSTKEEEKTLVQFLKNEFKQYADMLTLRLHNPEQLNDWIIYKQKEYRCMILGRKIQAAGLNSRGADSSAREKEQLTSILAELLEIKLKKEHNDIIELERRLDDLKKIHELRKHNKDKIIQNRFNELADTKKLFQW